MWLALARHVIFSGWSPSASQRSVTRSPRRTDTCFFETVTEGPTAKKVVSEHYKCKDKYSPCTVSLISVLRPAPMPLLA